MNLLITKTELAACRLPSPTSCSQQGKVTKAIAELWESPGIKASFFFPPTWVHVTGAWSIWGSPGTPYTTPHFMSKATTPPLFCTWDSSYASTSTELHVTFSTSHTNSAHYSSLLKLDKRLHNHLVFTCKFEHALYPIKQLIKKLSNIRPSISSWSISQWAVGQSHLSVHSSSPHSMSLSVIWSHRWQCWNP